MTLTMAEPAAWTHLRDRHVRDYTIFKLRTFDVADPRNGREYVRTVLEAGDWVNIVPVTAQGEVVLVRQFRFGVWGNTLEIPGGMCDPGEEALAGAARELEEETGFRPAQVSLLGWSHPNPAIQANKLYSFLATGCTQVHAGKQDGSEDIRVELVPRVEIPRLVQQGAITHSLVLAALYLDSLQGR